MRLFVKIEGIDPFVLCLHDNLQLDDYNEIVCTYFEELDGKRTQLVLLKVVNFPNKDKLFSYKRIGKILKFFLEEQEKINVYEELEACHDSILMGPSKASDLFEGSVIKYASLNRLILRLTDPQSDDFHRTVFWYTYRDFKLKPEIVLMKLIERYHVPDIESDWPMSAIDQMYYNAELKLSIQCNVCDMLHEWVTSYLFDFSDDMIATLRSFATESLIPDGYGPIALEILDALDTGCRLQPWEQAAKEDDILKPMKGVISTTSLSDFTAQEIAEQITLLDYELYRRISFTELLDQAWSKDAKKHRSPNLLRSIAFVNNISKWFAYNILKEEDFKTRRAVLQKAVKVVGLLYEMGSLNMLLAVKGALDSTAVHRLSATWDQLSKEDSQIREEVDRFFAQKRMREYATQTYQQGVRPCLPYIGVYLTDLVFLDDGNPTLIDGKVNFTKAIRMYSIMNEILRFQDFDWPYTPNPEIRKMVLMYEPHDDNALYQMSLKIQPRRQQPV